MLCVHRSHRADDLAAVLGEVFADVPADPFTPEVVAVPTRGIERWLTQTLALQLGARPGRTDGVVANIRFCSPRDLVEDTVAAASGIDPDTDPWLRGRIVWPLLTVVDEGLEEDWLALLAAHLDAVAPADTEDAPRPRLAAVRHIATLFDRYAAHRPEMVRAWAAGDDVDGTGKPLGDDYVWQAALWRALRTRIGTASPPERFPDALARVREEPELVDLPARLAAFNLTRLAPAHLALFEALAQSRDVHLCVLHPSPALWNRVAANGAPSSPLRSDDPTAELAENRLLASWGRDVRELQLILAGVGRDMGAYGTQLDPDGMQAASLLHRLQAGVLEDRAPDDGDIDDSIEIHACHGRARQVEVLRDAILHALANDPTLEPRDVIVMCPDIETFAPLIRATFGTTDTPAPGVPPDLHVRLADRSLRQTNPILSAIARLLELADGRMTASELLDLADRPPVRRRFGLDDDDLSRLEGWVRDAEIRWGLDAEHREAFKLGKVDANTWAAGIDRLLLGIAMTEEPGHLVGGALPVDDVGSGDIELAGKLAEFVARVRGITERFAQRRPLAAWATEIELAADLLCATSEVDAWQRAELGRVLARAVEGSADQPLALAEVRGLLAERLAGRPTTANFRTGHLTFCTLHPMRSVPHRVIALLGLDDGAFPRAAPRDGDDLILRTPLIGDQDGRAEDRQLLLDALMAAQDKLIITYTGNDERTNAELPPAVPVGELLDVIGADIVRRHPLQPFDPRNFDAAAPMSFDGIALQGARALAGPRVARPPFLTEPLPPVQSDVVALDDLVRFLQHPVKELLRRRLDVRYGEIEESLDDELPVELDGLEKWRIGDRLIRAVLGGCSMDEAVAAERGRGSLPPGAIADETIQEVRGTAQRIVDAANAHLSARSERGAVDVRVALPDGRTLTGTVNGVAGDRLEVVTYSSVAPKHRLAAWARLLALASAFPSRTFSAATLGRGFRRPVGLSSLGAPADPLTELMRLVDLMDLGLREPLPFAAKTSEAYAAARARDAKNVAEVTEKAWVGSRTSPGENADLEHQRVYGGRVDLSVLTAAPARETESGEGWDARTPSRFGRIALRVWAPLLANEHLAEL